MCGEKKEGCARQTSIGHRPTTTLNDSVFDRSGVVAIRRKEEGNRNENNDSSDIEFHGRSKANKIVYVRAT